MIFVRKKKIMAGITVDINIYTKFYAVYGITVFKEKLIIKL